MVSVPDGKNLTTSECLHACGNVSLPLAALINGSACQCGSWEILPRVDKNACNSSSGDKSRYKWSIYNATLFLVEVAQIFEEINFVFYHNNKNPNLSWHLTFDFGDGTRNTSWNKSFSAVHQFVEIGTFTVTALVSRGNSTTLRIARKVRVLSRIDFRGIQCSAAMTTKRFVCKASILQGTGIQATMNIRDIGINASVSFPGMLITDTDLRPTLKCV